MSKGEINEFGTAYLKLALEIDRQYEGYMDAYWGPDHIQEEVETGPVLSPIELQENHNKLVNLIPEDDPHRYRYLKAQVEAMGFMIRKLTGEQFSYLEEVKGLFGIEPAFVPESLFLEAQSELDRYVPGKGSLSERIIARDKELKIPPELIPRAAEMILGEIRPRTDDLFSLIPGEAFTVNCVRDKPWRAYNYYLGNYQSRGEINIDLDWTPFNLIGLLSHEAYPGHHTEMQKKESLLYKDNGFLEESCVILFIPRAIINEGIACAGLDALYPNLEIFEWAVDELIPALDLPPATAEEAYQMNKANRILENVRPNAAILMNQGDLNKDEAVEYLETYLMISRSKAEKYLRFIDDPLWKTYIFTYSEGYRLVEQAATGTDMLSLFKRLLTEQLSPEDLKLMAES